MTPFCLKFETEIIEKENKDQWVGAAMCAYQKWNEDRSDLNALLCAGLQAWLGILENEKQWLFEGLNKEDADERKCMLMEILIETTEWGCKYQSDNAVFNAYFGYMMDVMPYFFGEITMEPEKMAEEMIQKAFMLESENPLTKVVYFRMSNKKDEASKACAEIWEIYTPEQWGNSAVQNYFLRIWRGKESKKNR